MQRVESDVPCAPLVNGVKVGWAFSLSVVEWSTRQLFRMSKQYRSVTMVLEYNKLSIKMNPPSDRALRWVAVVKSLVLVAVTVSQLVYVAPSPVLHPVLVLVVDLFWVFLTPRVEVTAHRMTDHHASCFTSSWDLGYIYKNNTGPVFFIVVSLWGSSRSSGQRQGQ